MNQIGTDQNWEGPFGALSEFVSELAGAIGREFGLAGLPSSIWSWFERLFGQKTQQVRFQSWFCQKAAIEFSSRSLNLGTLSEGFALADQSQELV